jgi:hypothetical protein
MLENILLIFIEINNNKKKKKMISRYLIWMYYKLRVV